MHENSEFQEQDNVPSTPQEHKTSQAEEVSKETPLEQDANVHPVPDELIIIEEAPSDAQEMALISLIVNDEGLDDARTLLKAWVPDVSLSVIIVTTKESQVSYFKEHLSALGTFNLLIVAERTELTPGHIYVLPPHKSFALQDRTLAVQEDHPKEPIPGASFLTSYGKSQRQKALTLFFMHTLADFAKTIKVLSSCHASIIQHTSSPQHVPTHPDAPISHLVDTTSSIENIAIFTQHFIESFNPDLISEFEKNPQTVSYVQHIISMLDDHTSTTFSYVNPGYILFHVYQRLRLYGFNSVHQYIEQLSSDKNEITCLAKRISLKNTFFFNDLRSLRVIAKTVIPSLVKEATSNHTLRVWVPGCSSGEDLLSLSMLIHEYADSLQTSIKVNLLGTDNNDRMLQFARKPQYTRAGLHPIPDILKDKFFTSKEGVYEYDSSYLSQCEYALHHLTGKAPHTNVDVIYCKDVLPTISPKAQKALLQQFHEALSPRGILVLGSAEVGHSFLPFFAQVRNQPFIFKPLQQTAQSSSSGQSFQLFKKKETVNKSEQSPQEQHQNAAQPSPEVAERESIHTLHRDLLLQIQAPVSLMIRQDFTIVDSIGNVGRFMAWPNNGHTINLLKAFPKEVQEDLRFAVNQVLKSQIALKSRPIRTQYESIFKEFRLQVHPINLEDGENSLIQVIFLETEPSVSKNTPLAQQNEEQQNTELDTLKSELQETREKLKVVSGLLKDSKELLKKSKHRSQQTVEHTDQQAVSAEQEKIVRQNEELRSTNTELLELNRDLVRRIEELRRSMNRKLKEFEAANAAKPEKTESKNASVLDKNLELLLPKRHEVRTSLTSIIGFADLLSDRIVDKDNRELARYIGKSGHKLSENLAPLLNLDFPDSEPLHEQEPEEETDEDILSSNRVLVVEDSEATRRLLTIVLSDRFECEVAADGSEAIEKAEKEIFKAVLLDIDLGRGPNGLDVLDHLRQKNYYRTVPFMAVTSMATPQDRSMLLRKGFDAFVPKPFQKGQLLSTLDKMIDNSGMIA